MIGKRVLIMAPVVLAVVSAGLVCSVALACPNSNRGQSVQHAEQTAQRSPCPMAQQDNADRRPSMKPAKEGQKCKMRRSCTRYRATTINPWKILGSALIAWYAVGLVVVLAMMIGRRKRDDDDTEIDEDELI